MAHVLTGIPLKELTGVNIFECSLECGSPGPQGPIREPSRRPPSNRDEPGDLVRTLGSYTSGKPIVRIRCGVSRRTVRLSNTAVLRHFGRELYDPAD